jgi:transposase
MDTSTLDEASLAAIDSLGRKCGPRRRWPAAEKVRIVRETLRPGVSVAEVARRHELNANLLFGWRRLYQRGLLGRGSEAVPTRLVPVTVSATEATSSTSSATAACGVIEIELPNARVRVTGEVTPDQLVAVLTALARCR